MYEHTVLAFFPSLSQAERARARLIEAGVDRSAIRLSNEGASAGSAGSTGSAGSSTYKKDTDEHQGFFEWLFGSDNDVPERERSWYSGNLSDGRAALSARLESKDMVARVEQILDAEGALEVEHDEDDHMTSSGMASSGMTGATATSSATSGHKASTARSGAEEEVIPVIKEELAVGKRQHETRRRIRTRVIERPVQEQVQLRDETVVVERRPVSGSTTVRPGDLHEREFEIIERHEEPVVEKRARAVEEIVVKKDVKSRTETVGDKLRETEVEVEGQTVPKAGKTTRR